MKTTKSELEQMTQDPEQFINLALDTCDKQKSQIIKTQGAKLLEAICDNIDGAVSFATQFSCQAINLAFNYKDPLVNAQTELQIYKDAKFLQQPPEIIAETCMVALTAISYILPRRNDLIPMFEKTLGNNLDSILHKNSVILQARMSLLLGYYADMLFRENQEGFKNIVDFLIKSLSFVGGSKVIALQSADTLNTIISDTDLIPRLEPYLPEILSILNELTLTI